MPLSREIERLRAEHAALIALARIVTELTNAPGPPQLTKLASARGQLREMLVRHLKCEDWILYPRLRATDDMAAKLADAGLRMISLHIQKGQARPDLADGDARSLLRAKGELARRHGIFPAMVETIAAGDRAGFAEMARFLRATSAFEYALVTVAGDFGKIRSDVARSDVPVGTMLEALDAEGFSPAVFVGGRYRRDVPRWYIMQSVQATDRNGREMAWNRMRPGLVERGFLWGYALLCRKSLHWVPTTSAKLKSRLLVNGLTGGRISTFFFALRAIIRGWIVSEKHIIVQLPPYSLGDGRVECCDNCPDATVRNGRLHPVCLGDIEEEVPL